MGLYGAYAIFVFISRVFLGNIG